MLPDCGEAGVQQLGYIWLAAGTNLITCLRNTLSTCLLAGGTGTTADPDAVSAVSLSTARLGCNLSPCCCPADSGGRERRCQDRVQDHYALQVGSQQAATDCFGEEGPGFRFKPLLADITPNAVSKLRAPKACQALEMLPVKSGLQKRSKIHATALVQQRLADLELILSQAFATPVSASAGGIHPPSVLQACSGAWPTAGGCSDTCF